ncbi:FecR family protein [Mucilaginibacter aquaedulcis]|uniref:FecR family protein n=1 Tax=Mucilaginibacter aquaedulcis TaxID=1187081 RepID=UPI0025B5A896|nr:FecR family protein [Mucilaginibacter aquaedulcis]MDN3547292.1 FecR family protein [Mucilaginibacter aquaedulcis]
MQHSVFKKLLQKYLDKSSSRAERYVVDSWYDSFDHDKGTANQALTDEDAEAIRLRLLRKIMPAPVIKPWFRSSWARAAAILIIPVSAALIYLKTYQDHPSKAQPVTVITYTTGAKQIKKIMLQDSTVVWLNANSAVQVKSDYAKANRSLTLTGEAFFEVKHDASIPFIIDAGGISIKDIGTSFNVSAYKSLNTINVAVNTGVVQVMRNKAQLALLQPGKGLSFDKITQTIKLANIGIAQTDLWRSGKTVLTRSSFDELAQGMLNLYGVKLNTTDSKVKSFKYNLTLSSAQSEKSALEMICLILNKKYKKEAPDGIMIY